MGETADETEIRMAANLFKAKQAGKLEAEELLSAATRDYREAYESYCLAKWGLKFGGRVTVKGVEYVAVGFTRYSRFRLDEKPWLSASKVRKDGQPSASVVTIYSEWEAA